MEIVRDPLELQRRCLEWRCSGVRLGLVPTMGALHAGHMALLRHAGELADKVVASVFVNPTQFGPSEDYASYPRPFERDVKLAGEAGADVIFAPERDAMYRPGEKTRVEVWELTAGLCGASRPGHFRGVTTVVSKLLILALPHVAIFGEKDFQQLAVLKRMANDLFLPTEIVGHPIVREADGLALSSRNAYLTPEERGQAPQIHAGLQALRQAVADGQVNVAGLKDLFNAHLAEHLPLGQLDYLDIVDPDSLAPLERVDGPARAVVAVHLGKARLLDNLALRT